MAKLIVSILHKYASFLVATHDPKFVLEVANCFDADPRLVKYVDGNVFIYLDSEFFNNVFKGPIFDEVLDITPASAKDHYEKNMNKCKKTINIIFFQTARASTTLRWPKFFHRSDFNEYNDMATLLERVKGILDSHHF